MSDTESLASCLGCYENPIAPNGPCEVCSQSEICKRICKEFIPKKLILERIENIEAILRE